MCVRNATLSLSYLQVGHARATPESSGSRHLDISARRMRENIRHNTWIHMTSLVDAIHPSNRALYAGITSTQEHWRQARDRHFFMEESKVRSKRGRKSCTFIPRVGFNAIKKTGKQENGVSKCACSWSILSEPKLGAFNNNSARGRYTVM